jgi:hypothetical protein
LLGLKMVCNTDRSDILSLSLDGGSLRVKRKLSPETSLYN